MGKPVLSKTEINKIISLRKTGHSLPEIKNLTRKGYGTIFRYTKNVPILSEYRKIWESKRGGSKAKSKKAWHDAQIRAVKIIKDFNFKERMIVLSCLYWGEGNKKELSIINSDPDLIRVVISCLNDLGIKTEELKVSLRLFEDINKQKAVEFWQKTLRLPKGSITKFDISNSKKKGKLKYGMCRVRVRKSGVHFKLVMSMIDLIRVKIK
ncbi:MAG: hypothetical protein WCK48_03205 [bacterium]